MRSKLTFLALFCCAACLLFLAPATAHAQTGINVGTACATIIPCPAGCTCLTTCNDTYNAGAGNDCVFGLGGNDNISGGTGNDTLDGDGGNDTLNGDSGDDTLIGDTGGDTLNGNSEADTLFGNGGDDSLNGHTEDDCLDGGAGTDLLDGGENAGDRDECANGILVGSTCEVAVTNC